MHKLASKLRIGEKIGFGFGLVGLLFLGVIWQYHATLQRSLTDYHHLQDVFGTKKSHALLIQNSMLQARLAEKDFLMQRDEASVEQVEGYVQQVLQSTAELGEIDELAAATATQISELTNTYHQRFGMIVDAWRTKGLDHNSGLQGAFRDAVHELEDMAGQLKVGGLYLQLLQIRRGEKDLGLRREEQYRTRVLELVAGFKDKITASELEEQVKQRFREEIETYQITFEVYAAEVLANQPIHGGKGPFRQSAHRLESLLNAHYVPDLERNILQLRRREKDYLLRHDKQYVDMAVQELKRIQVQVESSRISTEDKSEFLGLMQNYQKDFLALVEQNDRIDLLVEEMQQAVSNIVPLVVENVDNANLMMDQMETNIRASSSEDARLMLWIVALASALGVFFAVYITLRIARPLREMVDLLGKLAYEEPTERVHFEPGGRDEVNIMAESVNTMADHKARFIAWWKASMEESDACEQLEKIMLSDTESSDSPWLLKDADKELRRTIAARRELLTKQYHEIARLNNKVVDKTRILVEQRYTGETEIAINTIHHAASSIGSILKMAAFKEDRHVPDVNI